MAFKTGRILLTIIAIWYFATKPVIFARFYPIF
ncbi:hypothetical protein SSU05_2006 [Streptococcus suis 05ZYH33]|nr:hypothetical protein SSU05_2006 [Streptococcus suis 05ZYH33]